MKGGQKLGKRRCERTRVGPETGSCSIKVLQQSCNRAATELQQSYMRSIQQSYDRETGSCSIKVLQQSCNRAATELQQRYRRIQQLYHRETGSCSIKVLQQSCIRAICVVYSSSSSVIEKQTAPRQRCCNRAATELFTQYIVGVVVSQRNRQLLDRGVSISCQLAQKKAQKKETDAPTPTHTYYTSELLSFFLYFVSQKY